MKPRSHWQLLCKFKRQFTRQVHVQLEAHDGSSCVRAVQGTTWPSRGQGELHRRVYRAQRRAQVRPKRRPRAPKSAPRGVQRLQEAAKSLQVGSARRPRALQEAPKKLQVGSTRRPRGSKSCPRRSKRRPRGSKLGSKDVQERSKSYKTAVQAQFDSKQCHPAKTTVFLKEN